MLGDCTSLGKRTQTKEALRSRWVKGQHVFTVHVSWGAPAGKGLILPTRMTQKVILWSFLQLFSVLSGGGDEEREVLSFF